MDDVDRVGAQGAEARVAGQTEQQTPDRLAETITS